MAKKNPCHGKHREFGNFAKTQRIWLAQDVNSLIPKVKDFCREKIIKFPIYFSMWISLPSLSFMYVVVTNHVNWHNKNLRSDRENTGNLKMKFEWVLWSKQLVFGYFLQVC